MSERASSTSDLLTQVTHQFSLAGRSPAEVTEQVNAIPFDEDNPSQVRILEAAGQHCAFMRMRHHGKMQVEGPLGDYAFAHASDADVRVNGRGGHGVGEGMSGGVVRFRGHVGVGAGTAMTGGTLAIYGAAGDRVAAAMRGGELFVRGDVGDDGGIGALGGTLVVGGSAGERLGNLAYRLTIFIRGQVASLAEGMTEAPIRKREQLRLGLLLLNASIRGNPAEFRRIVPVSVHDAEQAQRGEINPHWR